MRLTVTRRWRYKDSTIGTLDVDGVRECFTLEDVVRTSGPGYSSDAAVLKVKVPGETAIPAGEYAVRMTDSPKFGRVPAVLKVPGFSAILIHAGNSSRDTRGCLLVGRTRGDGLIGESRLALKALLPKIEEVEKRGEPVTLEILEDFQF